jgi:hypothetical protein
MLRKKKTSTPVSPRECTVSRGELTSLQYSPHAFQFDSSFNLLLQTGVCVAPQFEHSALTPPGPEEFPFKLRNPAAEVRLSLSLHAQTTAFLATLS